MFTSATCESCARATERAKLLESDQVGYDEIPWQHRKDLHERYHITDVNTRTLGSVKRQGMKSLWKARYDIFDGADRSVLTISEENPWVKVIDALVGEVPVVGMFTGYMFNPSYILKNLDETIVMRFKKQPSMFESKFRLESLIPQAREAEQLAVLSVLMMVLLERRRG